MEGDSDALSGDEYGSEDSDEIIYDSEEEADLEWKERQEIEKYAMNEKNAKGEAKPVGYDIHKELMEGQKFKATDGVKFVEYDEFGLPKNDGEDYRKYISTDDKEPDMFIPAPPEMLERMLKPKGERLDIDKEVVDMNYEGKYVLFG